MALIVEDGSQVPNANSYVDLAYAAAYHSALGHDDWAGDDAQLELALIVACRAMDQLYGADYASQLPCNTEQALLWPREWFTDNHGRVVKSDVVPAAVKEAQCELALMYVQGEDLFPIAEEAAVKSQSTTVGDLSESVEYYAPVTKERFAGFRKVELALAPVLRKKPTSWRLKA